MRVSVSRLTDATDIYQKPKVLFELECLQILAAQGRNMRMADEAEFGREVSKLGLGHDYRIDVLPGGGTFGLA